MNFYDILGVDREADRSEIRAAYRSLARQYHPDVNDHPDASDQFKVLSRARDVLTDETERSAYDRLGHADYVSKRLEGPLPDVEMDPQPDDDAETEDVADTEAKADTGAVADTDAGAEDAATADTDTGADTGAAADDASTADRDAATGAATGGAPSGATNDDAGAGASDGRGADTDSGTAGGSRGGPDSSAGDSSTERTHADARTGAGTGQGIDAGSAGPSPNDATTTGETSQVSADTETGDTDTDTGDSRASGSADRGTADATTAERPDREPADTGASTGTGGTADAATTGSPVGGTTEDAEPSTTAPGGAEQAAEGEKSYSTPPTPGGPSGPERLRNDQTRTSRRLGSPLATVRAHFGASHRWLVVVAAAGVYGAGLAGYLLATAGTLGTLWNDLTSGDLAAMTGAIVGTNYEVPGLLEYGLGPAGGVQPLGTLSVLGAIVLPIALAIAVYGLRRHATWRPSWLHVLGALGPLASVGLTFVDGVPRLPVLIDILLLVVFPAAVVASFLLNRLVLVAPLRRREDLGLP